jgi:cobalt/nickel transport system permease protein
MTLLATSSMVRTGHALSHLRVPDKIVQMLLFTVRYFSVIHQEYHRLRSAMKVRGFRPRTNLHTYRSYGYLVGMLLVSTYERSKRIYAAMLCRGFKGRFYTLDHFTLSRRDLAFALVMLLPLALIGMLQWTQVIV